MRFMKLGYEDEITSKILYALYKSKEDLKDKWIDVDFSNGGVKSVQIYDKKIEQKLDHIVFYINTDDENEIRKIVEEAVQRAIYEVRILPDMDYWNAYGSMWENKVEEEIKKLSEKLGRGQ